MENSSKSPKGTKFSDTSNRYPTKKINYIDAIFVKMNSITAQIFACISVNMCSYFVSGMVLGWGTAVVPMFSRPDSPITLDRNEIGWITSIVGVGSITGPILTWLLVDRIGRKPMILMCGIPMILSYVIMTIKIEYSYLLFARILAGVGMGIAVSVIPLYIGEITDNKVRGALGVIGTVTANTGILLIIVIGPHVGLADLNIISAIAGAVLVFPLIFVPESPYYYLMKDELAEATKSLIWLRRTSNVEAELTVMMEYMKKKKAETSTFFDLFTNRGSRKAFIILVVLLHMQLYAGSLAIPTYSYEIFKHSELDVSLDILVSVMSSVTLLASCVGIMVVDTLGRRPVLFVGTAVMAISLIANGTFYTVKAYGYDVSNCTYVPFVSVLGYMISISIGPHILGPIVLSEYFTPNIKAKAAACYTIVASFGSTISMKLFQHFADTNGLGTTFFICCIPLLIGVIILYFLMPETKGCSLETIENLHNGTDSNTSQSGFNDF